MMKLQALGRRRYVGNRETGEVHDRWHEDCEDCLLEDSVRNGHARGSEPDTLEAALNEGFETCPHCFSKEDPPRPAWAEEDPGSDS